jgi:hypothetical protein
MVTRLIGRPEMSVQHYDSAPRSIPDEWRSRVTLNSELYSTCELKGILDERL